MTSATTSGTRSTVDPGAALSHRQILTILSGLMLGMFLAALDQTIVATSIRTIADDLQGLQHPGLGHHGVPDHRDDQHAALRQAVRPLRPPAVLPHRDLDLRRRLDAVRVRRLDVPAGRLPRRTGPRRRRPVLARAGDHRRHRAAAGARQVPGLLPRGVRHVERARPGRRRLLRRAGDASSASPAGAGSSSSTCRSASSALAVVARNLHLPHTPPRPPDRLARRARADRRPRPAADRRRAGPRLGLGLRRGRSPADGHRPRRASSASCWPSDGTATTRCCRCGSSAAARSASGRCSTSSSAWGCSAGWPRCRCTCRS